MGKTVKKIVKIICGLALAMAILDAGLIAFFALYRPALKPVDAVVVLGAAINTPALYNRSLQGLKLYQAGLCKVLVLSGGRISETDISEAGYMEKVIRANAGHFVPTILEDNSHSTYENLVNTKGKIGSGKSVIIVSDNFHLARASLLAWREGYFPVYWSSPPQKDFNFESQAFYFAREFAAMFDYLPKFIFG